MKEKTFTYEEKEINGRTYCRYFFGDFWHGIPQGRTSRAEIKEPAVVCADCGGTAFIVSFIDWSVSGKCAKCGAVGTITEIN